MNGADRFELLIRSVRDYAIFLLDLDGNVTSWNSGAERSKGGRAACAATVRKPQSAERVVFLTGGSITSTASEFLNVVPNHRVQKPFGVRDLRTLVQEILAANERS